MAKVIFLDVDGVLNRENTEGKFEEECVEALKYIVNKTAAKVVLSSTWRFTVETRNELLAKLRESGVFAEEENFIGHTAHLRLLDGVPFYPIANSHVTRSDEILLWIKCNSVPVGCTREDFYDEVSSEREYQPLPSIVANTKELFVKGNEWTTTETWIIEKPIELEQFIIIDDLPMLKEGCYGKLLKSHFLKTSMETGLTMEQAHTAVSMLESKFNCKKWRKNIFKACSNPNCLLKQKENSEQNEETEPVHNINDNENNTEVSNNGREKAKKTCVIS